MSWPNGRPLSKPEWPTKQEQALNVVVEAAEEWVNEMREYIIPQLVKDGEDVSGQEAHAAEIDRAIETLTGEEQV